MRKLFKERKLFKGGNYMRKYGMCLSCFITPAQHKEFFDVFRLILKMGRK